MPIGDVLIGVGSAEQTSFFAFRGNQLETERKVIRAHTAGNAHARKAGQRTGDGVKVAQVKRKRIALVVEAESSIGRDRGGNHVAVFCKDVIEFFGDQTADLLSLNVVSVVVAVRKNVSTDKNAALGFRAETFVTALLNHVEQVSVVLSAVTVANTVETSEVGAGFRRWIKTNQ